MNKAQKEFNKQKRKFGLKLKAIIEEIKKGKTPTQALIESSLK